MIVSLVCRLVPHLKVGHMLSVKMPATSAELSQSAEVVSSITFSMIFVFLSAAESCRYSAVLTDLLALQDEDSLPQFENHSQLPHRQT